MTFLHGSNLLHRDLKPENLLVNSKFIYLCTYLHIYFFVFLIIKNKQMSSLELAAEVNCKLTDFGTTRGINRAMETQSNMTAGVKNIFHFLIHTNNHHQRLELQFSWHQKFCGKKNMM